MEKTVERPITVKQHKTDMMDTEYGVISYEEWCKKEVGRIPNTIYKEHKDKCWVSHAGKE
jgi:hypothetical protein